MRLEVDRTYFRGWIHLMDFQTLKFRLAVPANRKIIETSHHKSMLVAHDQGQTHVEEAAKPTALFPRLIKVSWVAEDYMVRYEQNRLLWHLELVFDVLWWHKGSLLGFFCFGLLIHDSINRFIFCYVAINQS